jgi:hypothetical protein
LVVAEIFQKQKTVFLALLDHFLVVFLLVVQVNYRVLDPEQSLLAHLFELLLRLFLPAPGQVFVAFVSRQQNVSVFGWDAASIQVV